MKQTGNDIRIKTGNTSTGANAAVRGTLSLFSYQANLPEAKAGVTGPTGWIFLTVAATRTRYTLNVHHGSAPSTTRTLWIGAPPDHMKTC